MNRSAAYFSAVFFSFLGVVTSPSVGVGAITGTLGVVAGIVSTQVDGVFQAGQTILGTINAPQLGLFLLGMCCPFANKIVSCVQSLHSNKYNEGIKRVVQ